MRVDNWSRKLGEYLAEVSDKPFKVGVFDCALFAADCATIITGVDCVAEYRGKYKTDKGAIRLLKKRHGGLAEAFDAHFARIEPSMAQRGDICAYDGDEGVLAIAVKWSSGWVATTKEGVKAVTIEPIIVWGVGHE